MQSRRRYRSDSITRHRRPERPVETGFEIAPKTRIITEAALLCGCLERQIRLRRKPVLRFPQPELPQRDIGRNATLVEKAAPQGSQADAKPLRQISFAEPHRQSSEHQFFGLADQ
jgi:hypothetical protein